MSLISHKYVPTNVIAMDQVKVDELVSLRQGDHLFMLRGYDT